MAKLVRLDREVMLAPHTLDGVLVHDGIFYSYHRRVRIKAEPEELGGCIKPLPAIRVAFEVEKPTDAAVRQMGAWRMGYHDIPSYPKQLAPVALDVELWRPFGGLKIARGHVMAALAERTADGVRVLAEDEDFHRFSILNDFRPCQWTFHPLPISRSR